VIVGLFFRVRDKSFLPADPLQRHVGRSLVSITISGFLVAPSFPASL
jgi:hypothetical protein